MGPFIRIPKINSYYLITVVFRKGLVYAYSSPFGSLISIFSPAFNVNQMLSKIMRLDLPDLVAPTSNICRSSQIHMICSAPDFDGMSPIACIPITMPPLSGTFFDSFDKQILLFLWYYPGPHMS